MHQEPQALNHPQVRATTQTYGPLLQLDSALH